MVDTARTESAIKTLLADNSTGDISEQDLRDFAETMFRSRTLLPAVERGAVADNSTDCSAAIEEAFDEVKSDRKYSGVLLPPGEIRISETIDVPESCALVGYGTAKADAHPGTTIYPHDNFGGSPTPPAIKTIPGSGGFWHHGKIMGMQVREFPGDGIEIDQMGEEALLDNVFCVINGRHGIYVHGDGVPCMFGRLGAHGNLGSGLYLDGQLRTHLQIIYLAGDNNGAFMTVNGGSSEQIIRLLGWKAERWGATPGHEDIFEYINGNGGYLDLGVGNIHCAVASDGAVVRQRGDGTPSQSIGLVKIRCHTRGAQEYAFGYKDDFNSETIAYDDFMRINFDMSADSIFGSNFGGWIRLWDRTIARRTSSPEGAETAEPGSLALVNAAGAGSIWIKVSGTGNTGWVQLATVA